MAYSGCDYNCWGCVWCYGYDSPKPKPILKKEVAKDRLAEAVKQARRSGLTVVCEVTEKVTTTKTSTL